MIDTWGNLSLNDRDRLRRRIALADRRVLDLLESPGNRVFYRPPHRFVEHLTVADRREVQLIPPLEFDYDLEVTPEAVERSRSIDQKIPERVRAAAASAADADVPAGPGAPPPAVDHRWLQSPVKDQGKRGTCVAHASLAALEAFAHIPEDLSEQHAHYKFMEFEGKPHHVDSGIRTTDAARYLAKPNGRVCHEVNWSYIPDPAEIATLVSSGIYGPPSAASADEKFGIGAYKLIPDLGLSGESIKNPVFLESLLALGFDVVFGAWVSWDDLNGDGILEAILGSDGQPLGAGGHAMLMVGYDRPGQYFIVKNSWGADWEHGGYGYFHYDVIRSCLKYGFVVDRPIPDGDVPL